MPEEVPLLGMVARFDPQKDHANLIDALGRLHRGGHRFTAVFVGSGMTPENRAITDQLDAAGLRDTVHLLGPRADIPAVMSALDVHVLSSAGEAFPNVLAEAMACGTPCVTTDVGDAAVIVGETGWVTSPKDSAALAEALQQALQAWTGRPAWAQRQAACRARIAEHFSIEAMVDRYRAVWAEVAPENTKEGRPCAD
ncbi:MAG: glycosyltransferase [Burkholderiales bacterium]|nr:glycosyltransferase [Burkholderiales bacterium]